MSMKIKHDGKVFRVESNRTRGVFYPVEYSMMLQRWVCTCADFRHRRLPTGQNCKHIEAVIKFIDETPTEELGGIQ